MVGLNRPGSLMGWRPMTTTAQLLKLILLTASLPLVAIGCSWMPFVGDNEGIAPTLTFPSIPTFAPADSSFTLTVRAEPVTGAREDGTHATGEVVAITAVLAPGWELLRWNGNLFGNTGTQANINMDQHQVVLVQMQQPPTMVPPPAFTPTPTPTPGPTATPAPTARPPVAQEDAYESLEEKLVLEPDPGVLANDSTRTAVH